MIKLSGVGASPGSAIGPAQIIRSIRELGDEFPDGAILVAKTTDPRFVICMMKAKAIVTEFGGRLSHTAIVALELGIPCVVAVPKACSIMENGVWYQVDGTAGTISEIVSDT